MPSQMNVITQGIALDMAEAPPKTAETLLDAGEASLDAKEASPDTLLLMGRTGRPHGVRGEIKVLPETDEPARFGRVPVLYVATANGRPRPLVVQQARSHRSGKGTVVLLKLEGIDSREAASALRNGFVYARASDLPPLQEDECYLHDLLSLDAVLEDETPIGFVEDIVAGPAQDLLVIAREGRAPTHVPAVPEFVATIDLEGGRVVIRSIEGLLDD